MKKLIALLLILNLNFLLAVSATPEPVNLFQEDGSQFTGYVRGDEWQNWIENEDGFTISQNNSNDWVYVTGYNDDEFILSEIGANIEFLNSGLDIDRHIQPPRNEPDPSENLSYINLENNNRTEFIVPLLLIEYPDLNATYELQNFDMLMNEIGFVSSQGPTGGFRDFYLEISYGEFDPLSIVNGWYMAENGFMTYGNDSPNSYNYVKQMIGDAIDDAEAQGLDWSQFDNDGDGNVDALNIIHAGPGAEEGNGNYIWSHKWNLGGQARFYDGVWIDAYTINPEIQGSGQNMVHRGVICHEFGHALGLPDLYDTDYSSSGIGTWGLMSGGSWGGNGSSPWYPSHMSAWSKENLGWVTPVVINDPTITLEMENVEENPLVFRMNGTGSPNEYFLFENRQKILSDQTLPNSGLLIWHIDSSVWGNSNDWHRLVDVEQADGNYSLNSGSGSSDPGDPFPGSQNNVIFANHTEPNSQFYNGSESGISAINIDETDGIIDVTFRNIPTLVVDSFVLTESEGDGDGNANPGETGGLVLTVYNPSNSQLYDITGMVESNDPYISVISTDLTFGNISEYGYAESMDDLIISISEEAPLGMHSVEIQLLGEIDNDIFTQLLIFTFDININQAGFPLNLGNKVISSPLVLDLNNDGVNEIIFGDYNGFVHVTDYYGTPFPGNWPFDTGDQIWGAVTAGDLETDGDIEIIVASKSKHIFILNSDGSVQVDYFADQFMIGTPSLGNIDDDSDLEIITASMSSDGKVYAINPDGSDVPGFPFELNEKVYESIAIADFNGNDKVDMVFGTDENNLYLVLDSGEVAEGFPFSVNGKIRSSPIIYDLLNNGELEMAFASDDNHLYILDSSGEEVLSYNSGSIIRSSISTIQVDNSLKIFFGSDDGFLHGIDAFGQVLDGWPIFIDQQLRSSAVFSDLNNDGDHEIIITSKTGSIHIFDLDGTVYPGFPMKIATVIECSPVVQDTDNDGDLEIITGTSDGIFSLDIKSEGSVENSWNMFQGNPSRTGVANISGISIMIGDMNEDGAIDVLDVVILVSVILGETELSGYDILAGDLNNDGDLDILDVIIMIGMVL
ncbi:MAG: M6 family metalloprotease domain-containing protein [Candidatus Marinimicrobia bacterium]|nr:M6 family metalloprotease domain-containing protein [Candidatus Neomarinimicrobiota bacterium]MBT3633729.1 M6 family metalloprotease domain-containing protein [Candidatus Neomarinimicrobiota bacterium]MBT3682521.1 M6 family metalloprotease domain-containing protein [Candidatus Neomarinimicrobiota bacterium]MBT3759285.1 M6 family metalloprotease domain-containing protein [Candidatus Neomarinimicrobiota bacterium]MBT3894707.1 M6 family metalloprotease domain-containing protein [Candidatus Neom